RNRSLACRTAHNQAGRRARRRALPKRGNRRLRPARRRRAGVSPPKGNSASRAAARRYRRGHTSGWRTVRWRWRPDRNWETGWPASAIWIRTGEKVLNVIAHAILERGRWSGKTGHANSFHLRFGEVLILVANFEWRVDIVNARLAAER